MLRVTLPLLEVPLLFLWLIKSQLGIMHVVGDGVAWSFLLGAQERRHHQASWSYLRKPIGSKSGGKARQGITKIVLEGRRRQTKTRNKHPVAVDPDKGRNATLTQEAQKTIALDSPSDSPCWSPGNFSERESCPVGTRIICMHCLCRPVCKVSLTYKQIIMYSKYEGLNSHSAAITLMLPLHPP